MNHQEGKDNSYGVVLSFCIKYGPASIFSQY